ncbi:MAG: nitrogenase [Methanospirillum sp.]|nr:nitrogenase [Methanospirillum sp.]
MVPDPHPLHEVNENQCQVCMPLGGVMALKGIADSMVLVHGSQGCSTYMRLSMVEHFNEPVDIASSSLNEKQTIYGGEENFRKGLDNIIRVYRPKVIGVVTTCLTETMGEDTGRMIGTYLADRSLHGIDIIPISTPSYSGTQSEGFWTAVRDLIVYYTTTVSPHEGVNIIVAQISPADTREIKRIARLMGVMITLVPDISMTLDRPYGILYEKIPPGGTRREDIAGMGGAKATIQFGYCCPDPLSPGKYLEEEYGVPLYNIPLPTGLMNMDRFIRALVSITKKPVPQSIMLERGWLCDAMADAHKCLAEIRPAVYGDPELVYAVSSLCVENGAIPALVATGTTSSRFSREILSLTQDGERQPEILEQADFSGIGATAAQKGVNLAIGHSGGKVLTERHGIPLVRAGYPVHDRLGGQRILTLGYTGTLSLLDTISNTYLEEKYRTYRQLRRTEFYDRGGVIHAET